MDKTQSVKPRILIIPARRHILEAYYEYIIRYLGNEFYFEMGYPSEPPYYNIKERVWTGQTSPLEKNPDNFDDFNSIVASCSYKFVRSSVEIIWDFKPTYRVHNDDYCFILLCFQGN